jgi:hypothetical protein
MRVRRQGYFVADIRGSEELTPYVGVEDLQGGA